MEIEVLVCRIPEIYTIHIPWLLSGVGKHKPDSVRLGGEAEGPAGIEWAQEYRSSGRLGNTLGHMGLDVCLVPLPSSCWTNLGKSPRATSLLGSWAAVVAGEEWGVGD